MREHEHPELDAIDRKFIHAMQRISIPVARIALAIIFIWFGVLKIIDNSSIAPLVAQLNEAVGIGVDQHAFLIFLGIYETAIGLCFLIVRLERVAILLLIPHLVVTFLPLFLLPEATWQGFLSPTIVGKYCIKNLLVIATAMGVAAHLHPRKFHAIRRIH